MKAYLSLKHYLIILFSFTIIIITVHSCKKEDSGSEKQNLNDLKQFYQNNLSNGNENPFNKMSPSWESVYLNDQSDELVYEFKLSNPKNVYQRLNHGVVKEDAKQRNGIRLLIFKDKKTGQIVNGCFMSVLNEGTEFKNSSDIHYKQAEGFSGKIFFFDLDGALKNGWGYSNGPITKKINGTLEGYYRGSNITLGDLKNPALNGAANPGKGRLMIFPPVQIQFTDEVA